MATHRPAYRVLIIEDDAHIARLISVNLTRAGIEARTALSGVEGLDSFRNHPPHLVLLDLMMPVMDGFQVCERVRAESSVPIIIMTARIEPIHQMRGFRLGADDFVLKPFDPQLLVARVIAHLRRAYRYNDGRIHRKDTPEAQAKSADEKPAQAPCDDMLAHMPAGWADCDACNYMAPLSQFPRRFSGVDATALTCPNCGGQGQIRFAVDCS
jgi:DNA-binding response OmpR family regulator